MPILPVDASLSWRTSLAILQRCGATIEPRDGYLVVRTPDNPGYHWGNCLVVTGDADDAAGWLDVFACEFPAANYRAIGLFQPPDANAWTACGVTLEVERTLTSLVPIRPTPAPDGYTVAPVIGDAWDALLETECASRPGDADHRSFQTRRTIAQRRLVEAGDAAWFAAFADDGSVASSLGIVLVGSRARYQSVATSPAHRRRGLARHLLGEASTWAFGRGTRQLVIVADEDADGDRLYRKAGFVPGSLGYSAYVPDVHSPP
ncbi:MAG: GNAT family N-acetyltransferase [Propionibacteriaceae bacterium]|nr:GNAT family N-acetyltransferase [Propionibacteriaceae bacterium]